MSLGLLVAIVVAGIVVVVFAVNRAGGSDVATIDDTGAAIVEFGKAYPALPIRSAVMTEDKRACFLRLADGRTGFVQAIGRHYLARLLTTNSVGVSGGGSERSLKVDFRETSFAGGTFEFRTAEDAAEVSLWLVDTLIAEQKTFAKGGEVNPDA